MSSDLFSESQARYQSALARLELLNHTWVELGQPVLAQGSTGQTAMHPLLREIRDLERHLFLLGEGLGKKHRGPQPSAVTTIKKPPSSKLRSVG